MLRRYCYHTRLLVCSFVRDAHCDYSKSRSPILMTFWYRYSASRQRSPLRSRSNLLTNDPSATALTKCKQVHAWSMSSYLGRVITSHQLRLYLSLINPYRCIICICNCCRPSTVSMAAWQRFSRSEHFLVRIEIYDLTELEVTLTNCFVLTVILIIANIQSSLTIEQFLLLVQGSCRSLKVLESAWIWFSKMLWPNQLILKKVLQMASFWPPMCIKSIFGWGFALDPAGGAYDAYIYAYKSVGLI